MKMKSEIRWLLTVFGTTLMMLSSFVAAADKVTYIPIIGGATHYGIGGTGPAGGIIFWVSSDGQHGLEAALSDESTGVRWDNGTYIETNAVRGGINAGQFNTERIIIYQGFGGYAASFCAYSQGGGYGDWYLPSKEELNLLYLQKNIVGGFAQDLYWSSTEEGNLWAWALHFYFGDHDPNYKVASLRVRCIRAF